MSISQHARVQCQYRASILGIILFSNCVRSYMLFLISSSHFMGYVFTGTCPSDSDAEKAL